MLPRFARLLIYTLLFGAVACGERHPRLSRLELRVDSLATTLAAVIQSRQGGRIGGADSVTVSTANSLAGGSEAAPVTIVEFTDYRCPFCKRHHETVFPELWRDYVATGKVRYLVKDYPLDIHPLARFAAVSARCVYQQNPERYWQYQDDLFDRIEILNDSAALRSAAAGRADADLLALCLRSDQVQVAIQSNVAEAVEAGLSGTPAFVIGMTKADSVRGHVIRGAYPYPVFRASIDSALAASK